MDLLGEASHAVIHIPTKDIDAKAFASGASADAFRAKYDGDSVVIKRMKNSTGCFDFVNKEFMNEIAILSKLNHARIVRFFGILQEENCISIVLEDMTRGSLLSHYRKHTKAPLTDRLLWALDIAYGVQFLHTREPAIIHRDLKSPNVLLSMDGEGQIRAKVSDFGSALLQMATASQLASRQQSLVGTTLCWRAPELHGIRLKFTTASDVYAYGVILSELLSWNGPFGYPWAELNIPKIQDLLDSGKSVPVDLEDSDAPVELQDLATKCTDAKPSKRPLTADIIASLTNFQPETVTTGFNDLVNSSRSSRSSHIDSTSISQSASISFGEFGTDIPVHFSKAKTATAPKTPDSVKEKAKESENGLKSRELSESLSSLTLRAESSNRKPLPNSTMSNESRSSYNLSLNQNESPSVLREIFNFVRQSPPATTPKIQKPEKSPPSQRRANASNGTAKEMLSPEPTTKLREKSPKPSSKQPQKETQTSSSKPSSKKPTSEQQQQIERASPSKPPTKYRGFVGRPIFGNSDEETFEVDNTSRFFFNSPSQPSTANQPMYPRTSPIFTNPQSTPAPTYNSLPFVAAPSVNPPKPAPTFVRNPTAASSSPFQNRHPKPTTTSLPPRSERTLIIENISDQPDDAFRRAAGDMQEFCRLFEKDRSVKRQFSTPLHYAAFRGFPEMISLLVKSGFEVDKYDVGFNSVSTPLHFAAEMGRLYSVRTLIKLGAEVEKATFGRQFATTIDNQTALHIASKKGQLLVTEELIKSGANVNSKAKNGDTPLHLACQERQVEMVKMLIDKGADVNIENRMKKAPLHFSRGPSFASREIANLLLQGGAKPVVHDD
ncbi:hypothetical protein HDU97_003563 [Phlyctochytrium planicorne]|nr:hypothetical protein HDU97_003563 [Phlyctochytrium planicorne]